MHTLVGILLYTTHQNPVLMTRNETELGSIKNVQTFKKQYFIAIFLDCATSALHQTLKQSCIRPQKNCFINYLYDMLYIVYIIHIYGSEFICLNSIYCISSVFTAQFHMPTQNIHLIGAGSY